MIYGYCRVSTPKQKISRQRENIIRKYPDAKIIEEVYTGTKFQGRDQLDRLLKKIEPGDTIVFDEVSRMSRNAEEGFELYQKLYDQGVNLVFLKESHINTDLYRRALSAHVELTGDKVDLILEGVNKYLMELAREQIQDAFDRAQAEVDYLHQRTREGIAEAKKAGKQPGRKPGSKYQTEKGRTVKAAIKKYCRAFGGPLTDADTMKIAGCSTQTYYRYKKELLAEDQPSAE